MAEIHKWDDETFTVLTIAEACQSKEAGIFIFAGKSKAILSSLSSWIAYFVGEIDNLQTLKSHSVWVTAEKMGATHIHIQILDSEKITKNERKLRVSEFVKTLNPAINLSEQFIQSTSMEKAMSDVQMTAELKETKSKLDLLYQYEKHYLELIKEFKEEIKFANALQEDLRRERSQFFTQTLKDVVQTMRTAEVDKAVSAQWIEELVASYSKSIDLSGDLAKTHVIEILGILNSEAKTTAADAKLDNIIKKTDAQ